MNERLIVKSFGPVKDLDIVFKKVTLFVGDQGTGKSCVAKLFSVFKWTEKVLQQKNTSNRISNNIIASSRNCALIIGWNLL